MKLKITARSEGKITVLDLKGAIALGESEDIFREKIKKLIKEKKTDILLNFDKVEFVDSSGVGALITCMTSVSRAGGKLKGIRPSSIVSRLLKITGVYNLFEFFDDEKRALASF